jgi:GAF domain-containing protein
VLGVRIATINLITEDRLWSKSCHATAALSGPFEGPRAGTFCDVTVTTSELFVVHDAPNDPRFGANPLVTGAPHVHLYAGAPLVTPDGHTVGTLCVMHDAPMNFGPREQDILRELAALTVDELELRRSRTELEREWRAGARMLDELRRSNRAFETLLALFNLGDLDLDPPSAAHSILELVAGVTRIDLATLTVTRDGQTRTETVFTAPGPLEDAAWAHGPGGPGLRLTLGEVTQPIYTTDLSTLEGAHPDAVRAGLRCVAILPLGSCGDVSAHLGVTRLGPSGLWTAQDRRLLGAAARAVGLALERHERGRAEELRSTRDPLTGLGNRSALDHDLRAVLDALSSPDTASPDTAASRWSGSTSRLPAPRSARACPPTTAPRACSRACCAPPSAPANGSTTSETARSRC